MVKCIVVDQMDSIEMWACFWSYGKYLPIVCSKHVKIYDKMSCFVIVLRHSNNIWNWLNKFPLNQQLSLNYTCCTTHIKTNTHSVLDIRLNDPVKSQWTNMHGNESWLWFWTDDVKSTRFFAVFILFVI